MATFHPSLFQGFLLWGVLLWGWAIFPAAAQAQPAEDGASRTAAARSLFQEGLTLLDEERWEEAADRFERALAIRQSPQITYNLTTALLGTGDLVRASELLRGITRDDTAPADVAAAAQRRLDEEVLPRIGRLVVRVEGDRRDAEVRLDDRALDWALVGVAVPVDPGPHRIVALRAGEEVARAEAHVAEGAEEHVDIRLPELPSPPSPAEVAEQAEPPSPMPSRAPPEEDSGGGVLSQWWFWTGLAVLVAAGVAGGVLLVGSSGGQASPVDGSAGTVFVGGSE